jgi:hypothetical protein
MQSFSFLCVGLTLASGEPSAKAQVDVLTQHNDNARTGVNLHETELTPANVNKAQFGMLFKRVVDDQLYTQPLVVTGVKVGGGTHDVVYVTTVNNSVYAFDANDAEASEPLWHVNFGTPANLHSADFGCLDINGQMGIIGTPVIDKARGVLYVVALTRVGEGFTQRLHELDLATGADLPESPVTIKAADFDPLMQNQRPALMLANGKVYVGYASHCDKDPYHGFLMAYDAHTLQQQAVFNTSPTGSEASIWQSGQGPAADADGNVYVVTGNGSWDGVKNFSESFLKFSPDLKLVDWFTPTNHFALDKADNDLNSSAPRSFRGRTWCSEAARRACSTSWIPAILGIWATNMPCSTFRQRPRICTAWSTGSAPKRERCCMCGVSETRPGYTSFRATSCWRRQPSCATLPTRATGGHAFPFGKWQNDGILWAAIHATGDSWHESRPGILHAFDADDIRHELWNSLEIPARDDCGEYSKMAPPTIANGRVYLASFGSENVGTGQFCVYGLVPAETAPKLPAPSGAKAEVRGTQLILTWTPVPGARVYRVQRTSTQEPKAKTIATGLTTPSFTQPAPLRGESAVYTVFAVDTNGESMGSEPVNVSVPMAKMNHMQH